MKQLIYSLLLSFLLVSCFEKDNVQPAKKAAMTLNAQANSNNNYIGDLYCKSVDGTTQYSTETNKVLSIYTDIYGSTWFSRSAGKDSISITINGNNFTLNPILKPDTTPNGGSASSYVYKGSGTITDTAINVQFFTQSTDPANRDQKVYYGSFNQQ